MADFALTAVASLLFVVDPVGTLPAYLTMTAGDDPAKRRRTARRASLAAVVALAGFGVAGKAAFRALGLTMPAFQIAGGLILFLVAIDMLRARRDTQEEPSELREGQAKEDCAITPLGVPMLAGPAGLSTVATLLGQAEDWRYTAAVYGAIVLVGIACYLTLLLADPLYRLLGRTGIHVLTRILGLVLAAIAVQFVLNGLQEAGIIRPPA